MRLDLWSGLTAKFVPYGEVIAAILDGEHVVGDRHQDQA